MTLQTSSMGLMANHRNILNATDYATANSRIVQTSTPGYAGDDHVQCVVPDAGMIEIGPLPDLSLVGPYKIYIHGYTGTSTDYLDVSLDVYEDDELVTWATGDHTDGELVIQTYTPEVWLSFEPDKEYRLIIRTGNTTSDSNPTIIDYIHLQQLDYHFNGYARWEYHGLETITGGASTATYTVSNVPAGVVKDWARSVSVQVWGYNEATIRRTVTAFDYGGIDLGFAAASGNLPATFYASVDASCYIELPYIRDNGEV